MQTIQLVIFALAGSIVYSRSERCLSTQPDLITKKHFTLQQRNEPTSPLQLRYGHRVSQQISTYILKILAEEVLGYEDVQVVDVGMAAEAEQVLKILTGCSNRIDCHKKELPLPPAVIDTEVWVSSDLSLQKWPIDDAGDTTHYGRYGWYMSSDFVQQMWDSSQLIADHWRSLKIQSVTSQLLHNLTSLQHLQNMNDIKAACAVSPCQDCLDWLLNTSHCHDSAEPLDCTVVLAGFPDCMGSLLRRQVDSLPLNFSLIWLGSKLPQVFNEQYLGNKPFVVLNWEPNTLTSTGKLTRITLPPCSLNISSPLAQSAYCDFPLMRLKKFAWSQVKAGAPEVYHLLTKMYFSQDELNSMLLNHVDSEGSKTSKELACDWLQRKRDMWSSWLPVQNILNGKVPVYLGGMFPMSHDPDAVWSSPGILAGAQMAVRSVNSDNTILSNYSLELLLEDTQCQTSLVLNSYIKFVTGPHSRSLAGILGPPCSVQAEIVAEVSPFYNTIQMGYSLEGVDLANRQKHPLFFRTSPSYFEFKKAYAALFHALDWTRYAMLTDVNYTPSTVTDTHAHLDDRGVKRVYSRVVALQQVQDVKGYLRSLKRLNVRVIIGNLFEGLARVVVCEAYKQGMTPQNGYVWFLPFWLTDDWWNNKISFNKSSRNFASQKVAVPCTVTEMKEFIEGGYFTMSNAFFASANSHVVGGFTVDQWRREYEHIIKTQGYTPSEYASFAYDAVWAYALALDKLFGSNSSSLDTIRTNATTQRLKCYLQQSNFSGVSGQVVFKESERFLPRVTILQHFAGKKVTVGQFIPVMPGDKGCYGYGGCLSLNESTIEWAGGQRPSDGRPEKEVCPVESFRAVIGLSCDGAYSVIYVIAFGLLLILVIAVLWMCIKRRYDQKYKSTQVRMEELGLMDRSPVLQLDQWEILRENVVLYRKLGEGAFGTVFGGEAKGIRDHMEWVPVAVKTLKVGSSPEEKLEFLSEAETMKVFDHPNIVKLLGVCTKGEPALAIMELMIYGDLKNFLLARRQFANQNIKEAEEVAPGRLTRMALDITSGLAYLSRLNFVHRDLALRNCMIGAGHVVKLGDFGMTRAMFDSDYYRFGRKGMLPVRWMAPESLMDGVFTTKSDVWGLGVTLWELCTMGSFPYQGFSNAEVVTYVQEGNSMDPPQGAQQQFGDLLKSCWLTDPNERPEPDKIMDLLSDNLELLKPCINCPTASVPRDDDSGGSVATHTPTTPKMSLRKLSQSLRPKSPVATHGQRVNRLSEAKLRGMMNQRISLSTPPIGRGSQASSADRIDEEFV
ncbi:receptor-type guanylate cyclase gcy-2-like [Nematostella vectensis]|uniref:receptor-type guanylate cyclase gcy-2-like n=1 Tax=Nematostella vectensis TaxID=45351 RepID=UPI0020777398|nr:receptor-type guanylate cyclase gcy-2-like [Nematostella vectensis]